MRIGVIGFGVMGKTRLKAVNALNNDHKVVMISEIVKLDAAGIDLNGIELTEDYNKIIENKNIDAVFVCTPNYLLKEIVIKALNNKKHVFCEKPPGRNLQETEEMIKAENNNSGLKLMFGFNHRHHDSMIYAKSLIDSKKFGDVLWMRGRYGKSVSHNFIHTWRAKKEFAGGGIFLDQGIHMLDLFLMMVGDFNEVKSFVSNLYWHLDVEDNVFAIFKNKKGQVAQLHSTMTQWRHLFSFEIFLEKGHIVINGILSNSGAYGREELSAAFNTVSGPDVLWASEEKVTYNLNTSWENEVKMFLNSIENDIPVPVGNSKDAYKLMKLLGMVYAEEQYD